MSPNSVRTYVASYGAALAAFVAMDALWLTMYAAPEFQRQLGAALRPQPDLVAAALFYPLFIAGLLVLAVQPGLKARSLMLAVRNGATLGLTAYATFDMTSIAIIRGYSWHLGLADIAWGTALASISAAAGFLAGMRFQPGSKS